MIQIPFHFFRRLSNEKANSVCWNLGTSRIYWYFRVASIIWSNLNSQEKKFKLHKTEPEKMLNAFDIGYFDAYILLWCLAECHASKSWWKGLCVHLTACASDIITLPCLHVTILKQSVNSQKVQISLTGSPDLIANRFAIIVLKPGARQDWAMKPSFSSARQMTSSPCFQSQLGMFSR